MTVMACANGVDSGLLAEKGRETRDPRAPTREPSRSHAPGPRRAASACVRVRRARRGGRAPPHHEHRQQQPPCPVPAKTIAPTAASARRPPMSTWYMIHATYAIARISACGRCTLLHAARVPPSTFNLSALDIWRQGDAVPLRRQCAPHYLALGTWHLVWRATVSEIGV